MQDGLTRNMYLVITSDDVLFLLYEVQLQLYKLTEISIINKMSSKINDKCFRTTICQKKKKKKIVDLNNFEILHICQRFDAPIVRMDRMY